MIKYIQHIKEGLANLYFAKLRSSLALIGMAAGSASLVALVLGGQFATREALKQFQSLGTDLLAINMNDNTVSSASAGLKTSLSLTESLKLMENDKNILAIAPYTLSYYSAYFQGEALPAVTIGSIESLKAIANINIKQGRFISELDSYHFYCFIGHRIYQTIKAFYHGELLGRQLQINNQFFTIVGIAAPWPENNFFYANLNTAIIIPLLASTLLGKSVSIDNLILRLNKKAPIDTVERHIETLLREMISNKNINFHSAKELLNKMQKQNEILTIFLGVIAGISLIVGGIGIMNMMLLSVIERKREIGVRLAVGATPLDICLLFLTEAGILALIGGFIGVLMGIGAAYFIAYWWQWQFELILWPPLIGLLISFIVGILSGLYPAYLAAHEDPIIALRA